MNRSEKTSSGDARDAVAPAEGADRTARRNIRVHGGAITVSGAHAEPQGAVAVMGETVPVDRDGRFVVQRIVPAGEHTVTVEVPRQDGKSVFIDRDVNIPQNDWFYVGLADLTVGRRFGDKGIETVRSGEFDKIYTRGRLAFYLKGKIKGEYLLTAAADTREGDLSTLFKGLDEKDARSVLRRLDPDDYYPVYGDGSTMTEDAPTQGKFYVRLERGDSHVMWGNYRTSIANTTFLASSRALYGAQAHYRSPETTEFGERKTDIMVYAAQPGTMPQREELRATGGSSFFLKRQDITTGSDTVTAEVRDPVTGVVRERVRLVEGRDYDIDYIQGVLILRRPLASITGTSSPVRSSANGGDNVWLVVNYEYTPAAADLDGYAYGGRAERWLGEHVRIGATGMSETTGTADQQAAGADVLLRKSEKTWLEAEVATSRGPGFASTMSTDGGLTSSDGTSAGNRNVTALAWRLKGQADLEEVTGGRLRGTIGGYVEDREGGFQTLSHNTSVDERVWGAHADIDVTDRLSAGLRYDERSDADGRREREGQASIEIKPSEGWKVALGLAYTQMVNPTVTTYGYNGERMVAGLRIERAFSDDLTVYGFGQATVLRRGAIRANDRAGVGATWRLTEQVSLSGEVSYGTTGWGALGRIGYDPDADTSYYVGYRLDPDRAWSESGSVLQGTDRGNIVAGMRRKLSDELSVFTESSLDLFGRNRSLGQTYGVTYQPTTAWTLTGGFESGQIRDDRIVNGVKASDFDRFAVSAAATYRNDDDGLTARMRGEFRRERSDDGSRDADTWGAGTKVAWKPDEALTLQASADLLFSRAKGSTIRDGEYAEASIAAAYRPVDNDRFNMLFKYTFLHDLPGSAQVNAAGDLAGPGQQSHILSADGNYDINRWLTVGAKYGMRLGRSQDRLTGLWSNADAHLGILRADVHVVKKWDLLFEARALHLPDSKTTDYGFLAAAYRHVGDNFKLGAGYNFGRFTDDLRDLTLDDQGAFINAVGKF
ncbi:MAG: TonB-dependent receptor [Zhengella sp.]|uniref:TonB-dependent receptor n=1 Tax=Zhengella sp. TaxID=2282762 RepID=UPI00352720F1|nr:TonB-dependent receptor [Brucellaceae bacterium]